MKTYTLIFALSFISSITFGQANEVSGIGKRAGIGAGAAASYAATGKTILPDTPKTNFTTPREAGLLSAEIPGASVISSAKQTQGSSFGEKVNQGLHAAGSAVVSGEAKTENPLYQGSGRAQNNPMHKSEASVASPGNPIGGIIIKGGKNR
ncbi:hypothetical protein [Pedobacter heparinus]|uniref:hypothetical protein n=1 Tax=Pedobacter heparinus TaxID=984 RepID=UPI00292F920E|nr:hypothetical protein [Pedobacter heparinus]